jgi:hypothetical protein
MRNVPNDSMPVVAAARRLGVSQAAIRRLRDDGVLATITFQGRRHLLVGSVEEAVANRKRLQDGHAALVRRGRRPALLRLSDHPTTGLAHGGASSPSRNHHHQVFRDRWRTVAQTSSPGVVARSTASVCSSPTAGRTSPVVYGVGPCRRARPTASLASDSGVVGLRVASCRKLAAL